MGLGPIIGHLPGALQPLPRGPRPRRRPAHRRVWAFLGDGETDEPESLGALTLASRERLDNLIFVVNCNLQRLDGPVRGNGKIIQELEAAFRGAGWNVHQGDLGLRLGSAARRATRTGCWCGVMNETVDGEYQKYSVEGGAYIREHFFGRYPELAAMVADIPNDQMPQPAARRPRSGEGLRRLQGRRRDQGRADRHPRQDDQGLRPGRAPARARTSPTSRRS